MRGEGEKREREKKKQASSRFFSLRFFFPFQIFILIPLRKRERDKKKQGYNSKITKRESVFSSHFVLIFSFSTRGGLDVGRRKRKRGQPRRRQRRRRARLDASSSALLPLAVLVVRRHQRQDHGVEHRRDGCKDREQRAGGAVASRGGARGAESRRADEAA